MTTKQTIAAIGLALFLASTGLVAPGAAQSHDHGARSATTQDPAETGAEHNGHAAPEAADDPSPATEAYRAANLAMHTAMDIEFSDDADVDFARGMIGHHQGAIDMARIVLEHGQDPELRRLAEEVIAAQEAEIEFLRDWLAQRGE